ncbi:MAG TPA: 7TM diverse intracellular signaling domain-containing protein, partial [Treponemataceae bacterium]|nr:7TM diverse intracellular signaling domain-containing protein [Treponemataceae bacterium]
PDGSIVSSSAGSSLKKEEQPFRHRRPTFELRLRENEPVDVYISTDSRSKIHTDMRLTGTLQYVQDSLRDERILFLVFGAIIALAFYNLTVFLSTKDRNYLYYFLYIFFMLMYDITVEGFGRYYLWPDWDWMFPRDYNIFMSLSFVFVLFFARSFLNLKEFSHRLYTASTVGIGIFLVNALLFTLPPSSLIVNYSTACFFAGISFLLVAGLFTLSRGYRPARFYLLAWCFLIAGSSMTTLRRIHVLPDTILTEYAIYFGTVLEAVLLAFALGDRVFTIQNEKLKAEKALIDANNQILQNRMKPHFLFNTMNIIFNQILESPRLAMETLHRLSENYHFITEFNDKKIIKLKEELNFLENYLHLMELRWPGKVAIDISADQDILDIPVPPFILQPLAENAFKHGLHKLQNKELNVSLQASDGLIRLSISNNTADKLGYVDYTRSLGNILKRLKNYYPGASLSLYQENATIISEITFPDPR